MGCGTGVRNPALDKAFPHGTLEIALSFRGLDFGGSWGAWEGSLWGSPGYGFGGANEGRLGRLEAIAGSMARHLRALGPNGFLPGAKRSS